jgi:hypothetical protein
MRITTFPVSLPLSSARFGTRAVIASARIVTIRPPSP